MTLKLLFASKHKTQFQLIKEAFENEDVDIIFATSIGLAIFLARKNQPQLIISQEELIDGKGEAFYCELQTENELAHIPFILLRQNTKSDISNSNIYFFQTSESFDKETLAKLKEKIAILTAN